ncbi:FAD-dependent oxidoreductase, partial [Pseudomonas aeruginosa]|nr:FAD-dependent oxidoreductase [Pseudomonas aeruginosa]
AQHSTPSLLKGKDSYAHADIELCLQDDVLSITPASCQVKSSQGSYAYDHLILATGSQPRFMAAFGHADNLCYLSDWDDAGRILQQLAEASRLVV